MMGITEQEQSEVNDLKEKGKKALQDERYEDAQRYYSKAISIDPTNGTLYSNRSATHAHLEEYENALKDADKAIELQPEWGKGYSRKGCALFNLERYKEAKEAYETCLKYDQDNEQMKEEVEKCNQKIKSPALSQPLANPFAMPGVEEQLKADDRTSQRMTDDPEYRELVETLKKDPKSLGARLESPDVLEILSVLLGIDIKLPPDDEDELGDKKEDGEGSSDPKSDDTANDQKNGSSDANVEVSEPNSPAPSFSESTKGEHIPSSGPSSLISDIENNPEEAQSTDVGGEAEIEQGSVELSSGESNSGPSSLKTQFNTEGEQPADSNEEEVKGSGSDSDFCPENDFDSVQPEPSTMVMGKADVSTPESPVASSSSTEAPEETFVPET